MELSQDIIYYHLLNKYSVRYVKRNIPDIKFGRPVFYENTLDISNRVVIIAGEDLRMLVEKRISSSNTLFICTEKPVKSLKDFEGSVIAFEVEVSPPSVFNYLQEVYNLFDNWDERLKAIYYEGGSFEDLIESCTPILSDPIFLADKKFRYVAYSKEIAWQRGFDETMIDENNSMPAEAVNDFIADSNFQALYDIREIFLYTNAFTHGVERMVCKNIFHRDEYVGRIIITLGDSEEPSVKYNWAVLEHLFIYADKLYAKYTSFYLREIVLNSLRGPLIDILNKREIPKGLWEKASEENGWRAGDSLQLVQFRPNSRYNKNIYIEFLGKEIESKWQGCVCLEYRNNLLLLINRDKFTASSEKSFYQTLAYFLRESLLIAGLSREFSDVYKLGPAYEQTEIALDLGVRNAPTLWYYKFDDFALGYMLRNCRGPFEKEQICSRKLLELKRRDAEKNTDYYRTLLVYFECRLNAAEAARKLYIHRSSFLSRMERIQELVDIDFDSNEEVAYLGLSLLVLEGN